MTIHPHEGLLRAARAQARTDEFKRAYPTRSMIERVIAWTATQNGRRIRLRYIGAAKNDAWLHNRCGAINLRTLVKAGLARDGGAWVLALPGPQSAARCLPYTARTPARPRTCPASGAGLAIPAFPVSQNAAITGQDGCQATHAANVVQRRPRRCHLVIPATSSSLPVGPSACRCPWPLRPAGPATARAAVGR